MPLYFRTFVLAMKNLILFGPPGSGKGTQASYLSEQFELLHLSTGDLLREEIKKASALGVEAKSFLDAGQLVPDEVVIGMISSKLDDYLEKVKGFIFDGFPRTVAQAEALDELLEFKGTEIHKVLFLQVGDDELITRLLERGKTSGRVDDQNRETIQKRIEVYGNETAPVADYYKAKEKVSTIQGVGTIEEIRESLSKEIEILD